MKRPVLLVKSFSSSWTFSLSLFLIFYVFWSFERWHVWCWVKENAVFKIRLLKWGPYLPTDAGIRFNFLFFYSIISKECLTRKLFQLRRVATIFRRKNLFSNYRASSMRLINFAPTLTVGDKIILFVYRRGIMYSMRYNFLPQ